MNPTRNVEPKKPGAPIANRASSGPAGAVGGAAPVAPVAEALVKVASPGEDIVTIDVSVAARARTETQRIDALRLQSLKDAVQSGTYEIDPDAIAQRIVEDALGPEQTI